MKVFIGFCVVVSLAISSFAAESKMKTAERIQAASTVLDEIESAPDQRIPEEVLGSAECVAVNGAVIEQDKGSTREFYGRMVPFNTSLKGTIEAPQAAYPFLSTLSKWAQTASGTPAPAAANEEKK